MTAIRTFLGIAALASAAAAAMHTRTEPVSSRSLERKRGASEGVGAGAGDAMIKSGVPWMDTNGNRVYAGGANIYEEGGTYYLVGEGEKLIKDVSKQFNLYSSTDLVTWKELPSPLLNKDIISPPAFSYPYRMERPKIFKCPGATTDPYRLVFHCDSPGFGMRSIGVLTAPAVTGPYKFASPCFKPDGLDSFDMGTFVDDQRGGDGKAYLVRSVQNAYAGISAFDTQCLNVTGITSKGPKMEGQAIMRDTSGTLHLMGSHLTGWSANAAQFVSTASKVLTNATWTNNYNPTNSRNTFNSQSTFIYPYVHADKHVTFMYMGDRWNEGGKGGLDNMTNIWLPFTPPASAGAQWAVNWHDAWDIARWAQ